MPIIKRSVRTGVFDGCESIQDKVLLPSLSGLPPRSRAASTLLAI